MKVELKRLKVNEQMPRDFWNYKVNPIIGYDEREGVNHKHRLIEEGKKYELKSQNLGVY